MPLSSEVKSSRMSISASSPVMFLYRSDSQVYLTSPDMWPFDIPCATSYRCPFTDSVSTAIFHITGPKHIGAKTLTFKGHVTSSITWPFYLQYAIYYWCPIATESLFLTVFKIFVFSISALRYWVFRVMWHSWSHDHMIPHLPFL